MKAGNTTYKSRADVPVTIPVFPLGGALLLPGGQLPLNLFEPRYLAMFDAALSSHRLIGMIQPDVTKPDGQKEKPDLSAVGCVGRIVSFTETGDGRYVINLQGVVRFRVEEELSVTTPYRQCRIAPFERDFFSDSDEGTDVDRESLLTTFRAYLDAYELEADWDSIQKAGNATLVNALSMMSPYGPAEKQALLEAIDLKSRAETLVAITELALAKQGSETAAGTLQ
ncbi:MAG: LON peptidase substrate-binding domain-containing protein [Pseudomonadota bacterium]